jgi:ATP-dependent 26S proteasome regulatory subunit
MCDSFALCMYMYMYMYMYIYACIGRFDQLVYVPPPDDIGRTHIMRVHTKKMPLHTDVDLPAIASMLSTHLVVAIVFV